MMIGGNAPEALLRAEPFDEAARVAERLAGRHAHAHMDWPVRHADAEAEAAAGNLVHERGALREVADGAGIDRRDGGAELDASRCSTPAPRTATCCRTSTGE